MLTKGLHTALIEKEDFSAGTSSRSTKLIHGGVRYLQKAIMNLDREQANWNRDMDKAKKCYCNVFVCSTIWSVRHSMKGTTS